ncbi:hypothetical protein [Aeromonas media]|uniref:hypothetical protein n=1 Tax=Aeromonas media TaxID=651 RepID=UPI0029DA4D4C|nr:hypothetical protein [Aeromonas media]MDX7900361.1 hypothetical protein [Aeromonas media]
MQLITIEIYYDGTVKNKIIIEDYWYIDNTDIYDSIFNAMGWNLPNPSIIPQCRRGDSYTGDSYSKADKYHKAIKVQAPDVIKIDYYLDDKESERTIIFIA